MTVKRTKRKYIHRKQNSGINHLQAVRSVILYLGFGIGLESWYLWSCKKFWSWTKTKAEDQDH